MKSAAQIYQEVHNKYNIPGGKADKYDIEAIETYAAQFKVKPCPCSQQEIELKEAKRIEKSNPK